MRQILTATALVCVAGLAGCSRPAAPVVPVVASVPEPTDTSGLPRFDSLDYANWKRFPVGTVVKRRSVSSSEKGTASTTSVETFTLKELTDREAVVERQNTTERSDGSFRAENPPDSRRYARQFPIPAGMSAEDFSKPSRAAKKSGEETLTVLGKDYKTTRYSWSDSTEAGKMEVQVWLSEDMPGRIVKQVMKVPALENTTVEEVIEVWAP